MSKLSDYSDEDILRSLLEDNDSDGEQLEKHIKTHSKKPESGLGYLARGAARTAKDLGVGLATGLPDIATLPVRMASPLPLTSLSELSHKGINKLTSGYTEPRSRGERILSAASEGIGSMPTSGIAGRGLQGATALTKGIAGKIGRGTGKFLEAGTALTPANVIGTGLAGSAGQHVSERGGSPLEVLLASAAAGSAPGVASKVGSKVMHPLKTAAELLKVNPKKLEAFEKTKLIPTLADVSDSSPLKSYQNMISEMPGHGKIKAIQKQLPENIKELLGYEKGKDKLEAGSDLLESAKALREKRSTESGLKRQSYESKMPETTTIPGAFGNKEFKGHLVEVSDVLKPFHDFEWEVKGAQHIPTKAREFYEKLNNKVGKISEGYNVGKGNWIKYNDLQDILDNINSKTSGHLNEISPKDVGALKHIAGNIKGAVEKSVESLSPDAHKQYMKFKEHWAKHATEEVPDVNKLLKIDEASGKTAVFNKVYNDLLSGDGRIAQTVTKGSSKKQLEQFSRNIMRELADNGKDELSPVKFATRYKKLKTKQKNIAFSGLSKAEREQLDDVVKVIESTKDTLEHANKSRTTPSKQIQEYGTKSFAAVTALASGAVWPLETAAALGTAHLFTKYGLTDQKNIKLIAEAAKVKNPNMLLTYMKKLEDKGIPGMASLKKSYAKQLQLDAKYGVKSKFIPLGAKTVASTKPNEISQHTDDLSNYSDEEIMRSLED